MKLKVKVGDHVFDVVIEDLHERPIRAIVDDEVFEVWPESKTAYTVGGPQHGTIIAEKEFGKVVTAPASTNNVIAPKPSGAATSASNVVRAPIPGVITSISVHPGDEVTIGQQLCQLEAMKMNNSIRANRAGKIETVNVSVGQQVKHNEAIMEYAD